METYLLEKSRVVTQAIGERNYHVFYQLIAGASDIEKKEWHLADDVSFYKYCAGGRSSPNVGPGKSKQESESGASSTHIDGVDDAFQFGETQRSLRMVGLSDTEIASVFKTLAAILWLGNVEFENTEVDGEDDAARVVFGDARAALKICAKLLGARPDSLEKALTTKKLVLGGVTQDEVLKKMDAGKACETRDALAKATYASLFKWIVGKVNKSFAKEERRFQAGALESSSSETSSSESFSSGNFPSPAGAPPCPCSTFTASNNSIGTRSNSFALTTRTKNCNRGSTNTCSLWSRICTPPRKSTGATFGLPTTRLALV